MDRPRYTNQTLSGLLHGKELKENLDSRFFIPVKCIIDKKNKVRITYLMQGVLMG